MKKMIFVTVIILSGCQVSKDVAFTCEEGQNAIQPFVLKNDSEYPLICHRSIYKKDWELEQQFEIGPNLSSRVKVCSYEDLVACNIKTNKIASTFLTYFAPLKQGIYKATLEDVPWEPGVQGRSCGEGNAPIPKEVPVAPKTRQATVIEQPGGEKVYKW